MAGSIRRVGEPQSTLEKRPGFRYIQRSGHCFGAQSRGCDPGSPLLAQRRPHLMFPVYDSNVGFLLVRAGVLPLDELGSESRFRAASPTFAGLGSGPSYLVLAPHAGRERRGSLLFWAWVPPSLELS